MAILDWSGTYPGRADGPSAEYPFGSPRNRINGGDGTPYDETFIKDMAGFFQRLLNEGSVTPSGLPDTASNSDYWDALSSAGGTVFGKDVTTSATDTTVGRITKVGDFGLGGLAALDPITSLDDVTRGTGFYMSDSYTDKPAGAPTWLYLIVVKHADSYIYQRAISLDNGERVWERWMQAGAWGDWRRADPQGFGLGTDTVDTELDCNTVAQSKTFYAGGSTANRPYAASGFIVQQLAGPDSNFASQYAFDVNIVGRVSCRVKSGGTWSDWQPVYTGANYQPETSLGVGVVQFMKNKTGGFLNDGVSVAGTQLRPYAANSAGALVEAATVPPGTWKSVSGFNIGNNDGCVCVRTA